MGRDWPTDTLGEKFVYYTFVLPLLLTWRVIRWLGSQGRQ